MVYKLEIALYEDTDNAQIIECHSNPNYFIRRHCTSATHLDVVAVVVSVHFEYQRASVWRNMGFEDLQGFHHVT